MRYERSIAIADVDDQASAAISRRVLSFAAWLVAARALSVASNLLSTCILSRALPIEDFGRFGLLLSVSVSASILAMFGVNTGVVRLLGASLARGGAPSARAILARCATIAGVSTVIVIFGLEMALYVGEAMSLRLDAGPTGLHLPLAGVAAGFAVNNLAASSLRGMREARLSGMLGGPYGGGALASLLFAALLVAPAFRAELDLRSAALLYSLSLLLASSLGIFAICRRLGMFPARGGAEDAPLGTAVLLRAFSWMALGQFLSITIQQADIWIASAACEPNELALYVAASRVAQVISLPTTIATLSLTWLIPELVATGLLATLQGQLRRAARGATLFSLAAIGLFICIGEDLMILFLGDFYRHAFHAAVVLSLAQVAAMSLGASELVLNMGGYERAAAFLNGATAVAMVATGTLAASIWGIAGLALVVAVVTVAQAVLRSLIVLRAFGVSTGIARWPWIPAWRLRGTGPGG